MARAGKDRATAESALDARRQRWFEDACARIDPKRIQRLIADLAAIPSPTGLEREASEWLANHLAGAGFEAFSQGVTATSGNAVGRVRGNGSGPELMLYAPLDTHLQGTHEDLPWAGPLLREDMKVQGRIDGDSVIGLGASNPKSMIATIVEAARSVVEAGVPLTGDLVVASCGGGMPWDVPARGAGLSSGVNYMLSHGVTPDCAVILKTWDDIYYEHPGMAWFRVTVWGSLGYAGIPRGVPEFRSSILPAAKLIAELEAWLAEWPEHHASGQVRPEGWISALRAGWPEKPAFPSAACEIFIDVRTNPDQRREDVERELDRFMSRFVSANSDVRADWTLYRFCEGGRTDPQHWVVKSAVRGWEATRGRPYPGAAPLSGQTDAAAICRAGVPVVRIGYPFGTGEQQVPEAFRDGLGGMGYAHVPDLIDPCRHLVYMIIDTCTRTREETGMVH